MSVHPPNSWGYFMVRKREYMLHERLSVYVHVKSNIGGKIQLYKKYGM